MCRFCTHVVHERVKDFEEPKGSMVRRWYASEYTNDVEFIKWLLEKNGETLEEHLDESN